MFEHLGFILEGQDYLLHLPSPKELKTRNVFIYCQAEFSIRIRKFKYDKKKWYVHSSWIQHMYQVK